MNPIKKNHDAMLRKGAMALAAAGASTAAHAATVQITFNNSFVSSTSGVTALDTDFGGDSVADIVGTGMRGDGFAGIRLPDTLGTFGIQPGARIAFGNGSVGSGGWGQVFVRGYVGGDPTHFGQGPWAVSGPVAFTLVDTAVRGGAPTDGWLDVTATGRSAGEFGRVDVHRFIFDDSGLGAPTGVAHANAAYPEYGAAVPEPSGLGLLALGAGGLAARRRRAMAA